MGVEIRTNALVERVDAGGVVVGGERIASRTVLWTAGVTPSPAGRWLKTETDRAPGRENVDGTAEDGYLHCGPTGAGHFVKMVHNGIEYGLMAAYAEGLNILRHANVGKRGRTIDAETTPLRNPKHYQYDFNLPDIAEVWRRGSVVASWLLDLTASALIKDPDLAKFAGRVSDSGEGRWTITAAIDEGAPAPVLSAALYQRFMSRGEEAFADRLLSAMRFEFGGHVERPTGG
jgi:6-phosphogluconate dehydrogenase